MSKRPYVRGDLPAQDNQLLRLARGGPARAGDLQAAANLRAHLEPLTDRNLLGHVGRGLFGALCVGAGYSLAAPVKSFWVTSAETLTPLQREAAVVLAAPAGWVVFALLGACRGIRRASRVVGRFGDDGAAREGHRLGDRRRVRVRERSLCGDTSRS